MEGLFGSRMNSEIVRANREAMRALKNHTRYTSTLSNRVHSDILRGHAGHLRSLRREERTKQCMKKKMEEELQLRIESHEKTVRDQIVNYVRKM